ncbi:MAG TPA: PHP-associated domain-containing protein [Anaerolineaceae bacterium]|nr:PHP-associated domain-containing protein [Anaerolineaceae bacterium]
MGFADLHVHTTYSIDGTCTVSGVLKQVADCTNLDVIAITDHDCITGALEALDLAPKYGIEVIPGCEVSTADGHLIALDIRKPIPAGRSLEETVLRAAEQGGFCIAAHPMARAANALSARAIRQALQNPNVRRALVGAEALNLGLLFHSSNAKAAQLARELSLATICSSDAHVFWMLGLAATEFPGVTAADLRRAIFARDTQVCVGQGFNGVKMATSWMTRFLLRRAGWVTWNAEPSSPLQMGRLAHARVVAGAPR